MSEAASSPAPARLPYNPAALVGAATPLWGYFGGAALTGVALWWMSRWLPSNAAEEPEPEPEPAPEAAPEPVPGSLAAPFEEVSVEIEPPPPVLGGEPAPVPQLSAMPPPPDDAPPSGPEASPPPSPPRSPRPRRSRES